MFVTHISAIVLVIDFTYAYTYIQQSMENAMNLKMSKEKSLLAEKDRGDAIIACELKKIIVNRKTSNHQNDEKQG
jgi:hypothetical protein